MRAGARESFYHRIGANLAAQIVIDPRYSGPPGSANGGYTCGLVAAFLDGPAEVTLRLPPPLGRPLRVEKPRGRVEVYDGDALVAEAGPATVELDVPEPVTFDEAVEAARGYPGFETHAFPECFVCGPEREPGEGLRIFAGRAAGRDVFAAPWTPAEARRELVWAALDCPGAIAVGFPERGETLLGRLAARVDRLPTPGEPHVVVAWPLGEEGRKLYAGTALLTADGEPLARARATWIAPVSTL
jgi:hypothetical protein